jgi:hypothetical protein
MTNKINRLFWRVYDVLMYASMPNPRSRKMIKKPTPKMSRNINLEVAIYQLGA